MLTDSSGAPISSAPEPAAPPADALHAAVTAFFSAAQSQDPDRTAARLTDALTAFAATGPTDPERLPTTPRDWLVSVLPADPTDPSGARRVDLAHYSDLGRDFIGAWNRYLADLQEAATLNRIRNLEHVARQILTEIERQNHAIGNLAVDIGNLRKKIRP